MQTSKYLFAAGLLAAVILPLQVQGGPDSEEQAKMRDALRRALEQPGASKSQPVAPAPAVTAPAQAEPAPVTPPPQQQPPPATPVAPPPATPTVVVETPQTSENVPASDAESIARAREAMRQKMQELQSTPAPTGAPVPTQPVVAVAPPPTAPKSAPVTEPAPASAPKPAPKAAPVATSNYKPIEAPASPFSTAKQAKLNDLLARYRADAITAQEYHAQRAAIIAEP